MNERSVPLDRKEGIGSRRNNFEKNLSTKQRFQKKNPRIPAPHENQRRTVDPEKKTRQGKKTADRLIRGRLDLKFPRSVRVRARAEYLKVQRSGRKTGGRYLVILSLDNNLPSSRFGVTVSRKTGNAVTRNRVKRRIRELQRLHRHKILPGKDIVVIATRKASEASFEEMRSEYAQLIARAALSRESLVK